MADVTSTLNSWSSTSSSNLPANSAAVGPNTLADNQRVIQAVVRAAVAGDGTIASAATTDLSTVNDGDITVTGTTTITGLGTLTAGVKKVLTFSGSLILTHNATSLILPGAANITTAAGDVAVMRSLGSGNWKCIAFQPAAGNSKSGANADITSMTALTAPTVAANPIRATDLQSQLVTAFTTGGTGTAFTLTPTPALSANAAKVRYNPTLSADPSGSPTLAVSGLTALNFKYYNANGAKQFVTTAQAKSGMSCDVVNDGTDWVLLNPIIRQGTTTNDNALAGNPGEYIESVIVSGSAVSLTTSTAANVTSISLTAGDWDVVGNVLFVTTATTSITQAAASINNVSATMDTISFAQSTVPAMVPGVDTPFALAPNTRRYSLSATTTVYLVARAFFTASTLTAYGKISARRVR